MVYNSLNPDSNYGLTRHDGCRGCRIQFHGDGAERKQSPWRGTPGQFSATLSAAGTFLSPGAYTITGKGGADIGGFSAAFNIPAAPALTSPTTQSATRR